MRERGGGTGYRVQKGEQEVGALWLTRGAPRPHSPPCVLGGGGGEVTPLGRGLLGGTSCVFSRPQHWRCPCDVTNDVHPQQVNKQSWQGGRHHKPLPHALSKQGGRQHALLIKQGCSLGCSVPF